MCKNKVLVISLLAAAILLPQVGFCEDILAKDLAPEVAKIKDTIFGMPTKIAGVFGGGYGVVQSFLTSSPKPLLIWGSLGLIAVFMNKIVSAIFGV